MGTIAETNTLTESGTQTDFGEHREVAFDTTTSESTPPSKWRSKQFVVGILLFFGYVVNSMAYQVIHITLAKMALSEQKVQPPECSGKCRLSISQENSIFNMYWYGFMFSAIGGHLAQKFGGSTVLGVSTLLSGIFTVATSFSVRQGFAYFMVCRGFVGLFHGFASTSCSAVFASWAPKKGRFFFMSNVIVGMFFGEAIVYPFYACITRFWAWSMVFQCIGAASIAWAILWLILVPNTPSDDPWISKSELDYILKGTGNPVPKQSAIPYGKIFKSSSFWALAIGQFAIGWVSAVTQYEPFFKRDLYGKEVSLKTSRLLNANIVVVPIITMLIFKKLLPSLHTKLSKMAISLGFFTSAIMFLLIVEMGNSRIISSLSFFDMILEALWRNKIYLEMITVNMAPNHAALLSGLTTFWQAIGAIIIQAIVRLEIGGEYLFGWFDCFAFTTLVLLISCTVFYLYGTKRPQPWSVSSAPKKND